MTKLDALIVDNVKDRLLSPGRLTNILEALIDRQGAKDSAVQDRRTALKAELVEKDAKLKRLYRAIEEGIVELDAQLKHRIQTLKTELDIAQVSLDRITVQGRAQITITPARLEAFSRLMREKLGTGDTQARKAYLRSVISYIEIGDDSIRIVGEKAPLAAVIAGQHNELPRVRGFVRKWRARKDSNL